MPHLCTDCDRRFDDGSKEMLSGCPTCGGNKFQYIPSGADGADEATSDPPPEPSDPPEPPEPAIDSSVARTVGNAATAVRDLVSSGPSTPSTESPGPDDTTGPAEPTGTAEQPAPAEVGTDSRPPTVGPEDDAQASARSEIVDPRDLPGNASGPMGTAAGLSSVDRTTSGGERQPSPGEDQPAAGRSTSGDARERHGQSTSAESEPDDGAVPADKPELDDLREELNQQFESIRVLEPGQYELNLMELYDREEYIIALQEDGKYTIQVPERWED